MRVLAQNLSWQTRCAGEEVYERTQKVLTLEKMTGVMTRRVKLHRDWRNQ